MIGTTKEGAIAAAAAAAAAIITAAAADPFWAIVVADLSWSFVVADERVAQPHSTRVMHVARPWSSYPFTHVPSCGFHCSALRCARPRSSW